MTHIILNEAYARLKAGQIEPAEYSTIYKAQEPLAQTCANDTRPAHVVLGGVPLCAVCALVARRKRVRL